MMQAATEEPATLHNSKAGYDKEAWVPVITFGSDKQEVRRSCRCSETHSHSCKHSIITSKQVLLGLFTTAELSAAVSLEKGFAAGFISAHPQCTDANGRKRFIQVCRNHLKLKEGETLHLHRIAGYSAVYSHYPSIERFFLEEDPSTLEFEWHEEPIVESLPALVDAKHHAQRIIAHIQQDETDDLRLVDSGEVPEAGKGKGKQAADTLPWEVEAFQLLAEMKGQSRSSASGKRSQAKGDHVDSGQGSSTDSSKKQTKCSACKRLGCRKGHPKCPKIDEYVKPEPKTKKRTEKQESADHEESSSKRQRLDVDYSENQEESS